MCANCAIVMYDCCSNLSLRHVDMWIENVVGNKNDVAAKQHFYQGEYLLKITLISNYRLYIFNPNAYA